MDAYIKDFQLGQLREVEKYLASPTVEFSTDVAEMNGNLIQELRDRAKMIHKILVSLKYENEEGEVL